MNKGRMLLTHARIVNEGQIREGHLLISGGLIEDILPSSSLPGDLFSENIPQLNLKGCYLLPGLIDDQVHFREPGLTHKGDIYSESRAAIAGGITSFMEMPNTLPQTTSQKALEEKFKLGAEKSLSNYSFYIGATNDNLDELRATDIRHVCGIKVFMGASTGNMLVDKPDSLQGIFRLKNMPVAVHCEDEATIQNNLAEAKNRYGDQIPIGQHPVIRSHEACERSSRLAVSLASRFNTRLHLLHLSTASELRLLEAGVPLSQKQITAEVCVHHLWFNRNDYSKRGSLIKWNPAIKDERDRLALVSALNQGLIDVVATDHAPHSLGEKQQPYTRCPSGAPMVQHSLVAMYRFVKEGILSIEKLVELMCHNPAIIFSVSRRGFIRKGYAADLVVLDTESSTRVERDSLLYKCGWSPMEGLVLPARVRHSFVNGIHVYDDGKFNEEYKGQALRFSR